MPTNSNVAFALKLIEKDESKVLGLRLGTKSIRPGEYVKASGKAQYASFTLQCVQQVQLHSRVSSLTRQCRSSVDSRDILRRPIKDKHLSNDRLGPRRPVPVLWCSWANPACHSARLQVVKLGGYAKPDHHAAVCGQLHRSRPSAWQLATQIRLLPVRTACRPRCADFCTSRRKAVPDLASYALRSWSLGKEAEARQTNCSELFQKQLSHRSYH